MRGLGVPYVPGRLCPSVWGVGLGLGAPGLMSLPDHLIPLRDEAMNTTCADIVAKRGWPLSRGIDRAGPCPVCGGTDRFSVHVRKNTFHCRQCGLSGSGSIALVQQVDNVTFVQACEIVTGRRAEDPVDPARAEELRRKAASAAEERDRQEREYREKARADGYALWRNRSADAGRGIVLQYLQIRGLLTSDLLSVWPEIKLGQHDGLVYWLAVRGERRPIELAKSVAMLAPVQLADGRFGAVHRTWLDLDQPNGKLRVLHPQTGAPVDVKKTLGTKQGGAIRLYTPEDACRIVMGEGIETTLTALAHNFEPKTAYWAGVDVGNMAGKACLDRDHKRIEARPDLDDCDCFLPPEWCEQLIYLGETESGGRNTISKLTRGLLRARMLRQEARIARPDLPDLSTELVEPPADGDLNDIVKTD